MPTAKEKKKKKVQLMKPLHGRSSAIPLTDSMLKVMVGDTDSTRNFYIHEALLTSRSKFFEKAMENGWKEAEEKLVKLPEDKPEAFALYEQLVYTGRIPDFDDRAERVEDLGSSETSCAVVKTCEHEYELLAELYVLAEKLQDIKAKNETVKAIIAKMTHEAATIKNLDTGPCLPGFKAITTMYEKTPAHCAGRQAFLDGFTYYAQHDILEGISLEQGPDKKLPSEFLVDLASNLIKYRPQQKEEMPHENIERYEVDEDCEFDMVEWMDLECVPD